MARAIAGLGRPRALLASVRIVVKDLFHGRGSELEREFWRRPVVQGVCESDLSNSFCRQLQDEYAASVRVFGGKAGMETVIDRRFGQGMANLQYLVAPSPAVYGCQFAAYRTLVKPRGRGSAPANTRKRDDVGGEQQGGKRQSRGRTAFGDAGMKKKSFLRRKGDAPSGLDRAAVFKSKERQGKRKSRQLDALGRVRNSSHSGQRVDSSATARPRTDHLKGFRLKRREIEDDDNEEARPKRRRRLMRLNPRDPTNKRIEESTPVITPPAKFVKMRDAVESEDETGRDPGSSKNAQFKAIVPSSEILRHIDSHLLGMRRLWEWRKAGYQPKLKAPLDDVPHGSKEERLPIQETVFKRKLTFIAAAKVSSSLPAQVLPEIAFAGRSNVGKSSLINALTRQWGVVRTSDKPGLTQSINFYTLGARLCLVDLPGYGFAYAKDETKEAWEDLVKQYVTTRKGLKRVCLLVDAKWGLKPRDEELICLMENAQTKYQVVLTKTDILPPIDLARRTTQVQEALENSRCLVSPVLMVSSQTGGGIPHLRQVLANLALASSHPS